MTGEVRKGGNGPTAINIRLGWVLSGLVINKCMPISQPTTNLAATHALRCATSPTQPKSQGIERDLRAFWDLQSLGILKQERSVHDEFQSTIAFGRHEVNRPWMEQHKILHDNFGMSYR